MEDYAKYNRKEYVRNTQREIKKFKKGKDVYKHSDLKKVLESKKHKGSRE